MYRVGNLVHKLAVDRKQIPPVASRPARPNDMPAARVTELGSDRKLSPNEREGAGHNVTDTETRRDFAQRKVSVSQARGGESGNDMETRRLGKLADDAVGNDVSHAASGIDREPVGERNDSQRNANLGRIAVPRRKALPLLRWPESIDPYRVINVLEVTFAQVFDIGVKRVAQ